MSNVVQWNKTMLKVLTVKNSGHKHKVQFITKTSNCLQPCPCKTEDYFSSIN